MPFTKTFLGNTMAKLIITAQEVREARKEGRTEMVVPPGAIVTPQARDDARDCGIRLAETGRPVAPCCAASPSAALPHAVAGGNVPGRITLYAGQAFEETPGTAVVRPQDHPPAESCAPKNAESCAKAAPVGQGLTHLDAASMVAKTHPRIEARGRLDSLMAAAVLVQTQFDPKGKLPAMLKDCLAEVKEWIFQSLAAEISGSILPPQGMGGMDADVLRTVSRNPRQYLHTDHLTPDAALGANIALLNWLRAQVREAELAAAKAALCRTDIQESLNRLSSAVYVLMLLTHLAESGVGVPKLQ